jgi:hypothetical protein
MVEQAAVVSSSVIPSSATGSTRSPLLETFSDAPGEIVTMPTSSGIKMRFMEEGDGWYASTPEVKLPVHTGSSTSIGSYLGWLLEKQDWSVIRSRIHVLSGSESPTGSKCVYFGKLGLMGGVPEHNRKVEWIPGPHMQLSSEDECREVYNIPVGYRYRGYRIKSGSVVQRASCMVRYVEANSEEAIKRLLDSQVEHSAEGSLSADIPNVATVGNIEGGIRRARLPNQRIVQSAQFRHAALILYGKTKRDKLLRPKSKIELTLEVALLETRDLTFCCSISIKHSSLIGRSVILTVPDERPSISRRRTSIGPT